MSPSSSDSGLRESTVDPSRRVDNLLSDLGEEEVHKFLENLSPSSPIPQASKPKKRRKHKKQNKALKHLTQLFVGRRRHSCDGVAQRVVT